MKSETKFRAGDKVIICDKLAIIQARGTLGDLEYYLKKGKVPFRWVNTDYGSVLYNCHSHIPLDEIRHLTPLEEALL